MKKFDADDILTTWFMGLGVTVGTLLCFFVIVCLVIRILNIIGIKC